MRVSEISLFLIIQITKLRCSEFQLFTLNIPENGNNQGWYPLPTYPPTHWVLLGGWVVKKKHKNPLFSKIMTYFFKKIRFL